MDFASQRSWDLTDAQIRYSTISGSALSDFEFIEHGDRPTYWHIWHIIGNQRAAFISYISDPKDAPLEAVAALQIVESFRWL
jgi:hypothetical protein